MSDNALFWKKALNCDDNIIRTGTLALINKWKLGLFLSKYHIPSINIAVSDIKCRIIWKHFVDMAHNSGKIQFCLNSCMYIFSITFMF